MWGVSGCGQGIGSPLLIAYAASHTLGRMRKQKPNAELTTSELHALRAYEKFTAQHGAPPSVRQLAALCGITHNPAHYIIGRLRDKGAITQVRLRVSAKGKKAI